jgi:hypothetical protein
MLGTLASARQQFVKVIPASRVFKAFVVHDETFDQVFRQMGGSPLAKSGAAHRPHSVADGQDHVQSVEFGGVAFAIGCRY